MAKLKTLSEAETARRGAITGLRNLGRDDDADRIEGMSTREYAAEKGVEIIAENTNPHRRMTMPRKSKEAIIAELTDRLSDLEDENQQLTDQLEQIQDVLSGPDEDEDDDGDEEDDEDDDEEEDAEDGAE